MPLPLGLANNAPQPPTRSRIRLACRRELARCYCRILSRQGSLSGIRRAALASWFRQRVSQLASASSWRSSRPFATRASDGSDLLPITPSPRNAEAYSCGDTSERMTRRAAACAIAAAVTAPRLGMNARYRAGLATQGAPVTVSGLLASLGHTSSDWLSASAGIAVEQELLRGPSDPPREPTAGRSNLKRRRAATVTTLN